MERNQQSSEWDNLPACSPKDAQEKPEECRRARYLECILNGSGISAIVATDSDFIVRYYNPAAERLFDLNPPETGGKQINDIPALGLTEAGRFQEMVDSIAETGEYYYFLERRVEDESRQIESLFTGIHDDQQNLVGYILNARDVTSRKTQEARITRKVAEEQCLGMLLHLSLGRMDVDTFLQRSLESLLESIPWLNLLPKGAIFLVDQQGQKESLRLVAKYRLAGRVEGCCQQVAFGYCICGRAANQRELLYVADSSDSRHDLTYPGMEPHGHYSVPLLLGDTLLGVLTLYLSPGHQEKMSDKAFLKRVADVLCMGISKRQTESALAYEAQYDGLTDLPNRRQIVLHIDQALARSRRHGYIGAVMFIDLDHFKNINDSLGHNIGDQVLQQVARRLVNTLRQEDVVGRLGGDEFVVLLSDESRSAKRVAKQAQLVAEKIRESVSITYNVDGYSLNVTPSIGIALFPDNNETTSQVLQQADTAMYRAKADGRDCVRFFLPVMQELANERLLVEQNLRWALEQQKLQLRYQPQVDFSGRLIGAEVLLRCPDKQGSFNRIDLCIDVAESTGLILPIGEWVLREACLNLKRWLDSGKAGPLSHFCINISPKQFLQRDFVSLVERIIGETGVDPRQLVLEITESTLIDAKADAMLTMQELRSIGIRVAMDDFGTGYSSLSYLTHLPLDILKIDRSFVSGISLDPRNAAVVQALMTMARELQINVIAEGVETLDDLNFLIQKGCHYFQGYHFSEPQSMQEFNNYLEQQLH